MNTRLLRQRMRPRMLPISPIKLLRYVEFHQQKIGENEYKVTQAENEAKNAANLANKASEVS